MGSLLKKLNWRNFAAKGLLNWMPSEMYLRHIYKTRMGYKPDLKNPKTYNEKLQWLKIHDHNPEYTRMVDKYESKKYVADIIGEEYIIPTIGVWDGFDDIDFSSLPDKFVLKCTHDSGGLSICRDKNSFDIEKAKKKIERSLKRNYYWANREWPYKNVKPRIIAEEYMEDENATEEVRGLTDYKFFCFNGRPEFLYVSRGLENHSTAKISFYDLEGKEMYFHRNDYAQIGEITLPDNFDEMIEKATVIAEKVSCPFVRVDLYSIKGSIYFSEITFFPCSGTIPFEPKSADEDLGKMIKLPIDKD